MSPREQQAPENFLAQLTQAHVGAKGPQAEVHTLDTVARQPDTAYLLMQRTMLLDQALTSAQAQIATLQNQLWAAQAGHDTSFMDSASNWGGHASNPMPNPAYAPQQVAPVQMPPRPQPAPAQPARSGSSNGGLGSAPGSVATTAAGMAGDALLFQSVEDMFHHNSGGGDFFGQQSVMGGTMEAVINSYYDSNSNGNSGTTNTTSRDNSPRLADDSDLGSSDYSNDNSMLS